MTNIYTYSVCWEAILIRLLFGLFIWEKKEVQNLSTGDDRLKNIAWNWLSLRICIYFGGVSKIIYIQQNTFMKWTENIAT